MFSLGRSVDINYPSNKWLVIISLLVATVMAVFMQNVLQGLLVAVGFFLCWALAREIDPAHNVSAFVAGFIFVISTLFIYDGLQIALLFWLLLATRLISKVCGKIPKTLDIITVVGISGYLTYSLSSPVFIMLSGIMLILAWIRYDRAVIFLRAAVGVILITAIVSIIIPWQISEIVLQIYTDENIFVVLSMVFTSMFLLQFQLRVLDWQEVYEDDLGGSVDYKSMKLALIFFGAAFIATLLFVDISYSSILVLFAALVGVNVHALYIFLRKRFSRV